MSISKPIKAILLASALMPSFALAEDIPQDAYSKALEAYNASKFGLTGFSQAIMLDLRKYGVKVSMIMPGSVASNFNNHIPTETDDWKIQPEDIGEIIIDLMKMNPRTLPSKIEVRPSSPASSK